MLSYKDLKEKFKISDTEIFRFLQIKNWIKNNLDLTFGAPSVLEKILEKKEVKNRRLIGATYGELQKAENNDILLQNIYDKWKTDLDMDISGSRWKEAMNLTYKVTTNENLRLIQCKLMTRIYYTRDRLKKFDSKTSDLCIKCKLQPDSLLHSFWECPKIRNEWRKIEEWMSDICKRKMDFSVEKCIFQLMDNVRYPMGWQIMFSSLIFKKNSY